MSIHNDDDNDNIALQGTLHSPSKTFSFMVTKITAPKLNKRLEHEHCSDLISGIGLTVFNLQISQFSIMWSP